MEKQEKEVETVDPIVKESEEESVEEPQISAYEIELRKISGKFLAQLSELSCLTGVPRNIVEGDAEKYVSLMMKITKKEDLKEWMGYGQKQYNSSKR